MIRVLALLAAIVAMTVGQFMLYYALGFIALTIWGVNPSAALLSLLVIIYMVLDMIFKVIGGMSIVGAGR